ncbi:hypothetical protein [Salinibius halmophilus]|uniref:hypothetical protein n=1 Tax=Salinibius halmophilus TaxID=1853216 RepID=UPI000E66011F|nr:hypothetical protein [Salinibius halmophilus]
MKSKEGKAAVWIIVVGLVGLLLYALFSLTPIGQQAFAQVVQVVLGEPEPPPVRHYSLQRAFETCRQNVYKDAQGADIQQVTLDARSTRYVESRVEYLVFLDVKIADRDPYWSSCEISASTLEIQRFRLRASNSGGVGNIFGF